MLVQAQHAIQCLIHVRGTTTQAALPLRADPAELRAHIMVATALEIDLRGTPGA